VSNFLRIVASAFATSITTTMWDRREALHQTRLAESSSVLTPSLQHALHGLQSLGLSSQGAAAVLSRALVREAYLMAALDFFWISGVITLVSLGMLWLVRRPSATHGVAAAE
jgi:DHA2 family multidrug resistance protein